MSIILRALTSSDDREIADCLALLKSSHAGTGFMHEAFWKDDASKFTRSWFAWTNALFGELIVKLTRQRPHLLCP
jgi:meiotically up-regulated gene 157 (Mug157) protein